jgi:predicted ester cyclase
MATAMEGMEGKYRAFIKCMNEKGDIGSFLPSHYDWNGQQYTPESFASQMQENGEIEIEIDAITVDEGSQRLACTILKKWKTSKQIFGFDPPEKTILVVEKHLNWFVDGKLSKTISLADKEGIHRQLTNAQAQYIPDLVATSSGNESLGNVQSTSQLEELYRSYLACINERTLSTDWDRFVQPQVTYKGTCLTLETYCQNMQDVLKAIPDLFVDLHTIIADERTQRVAVRLEATGTLPSSLTEVETTGSQGKFAEHLTYQFVDGKIARAWSIADWGSNEQLVSG